MNLKYLKVWLVAVTICLSFLDGLSQDMKQLNGYKVVYLPYQFNTIVSQLELRFNEMGFKVYHEESKLLADEDVKDDPLIVLIGQVTHSYSYPHTTLNLQLINFKEQVLFNRTADTRGKSFVSFDLAKDQRWVVDKLFESFGSFRLKFDPAITLSKRIESELPEVETTNETEESIKEYLSRNTLDPIEGIYKSVSDGVGANYRIGIIEKDNRLIAVILESSVSSWKKGEVKAVFERSSVKGVYGVKWYMRDKKVYDTFGQIEGDAILTIELKDPKSGNPVESKFIKMFPSSLPTSPGNSRNVQGSGSGFFMTSNGIIATNAHVLEGASSIEVVYSDQNGEHIHKAKILLKDSNNDVALIQIADEDFKPIKSIPYTIKENASVGSNVFTIGYPLNDVMGTNHKVTNGIISANSGIADDIRYYQISVPLQPGNSGGPLFNKDGNVVGITSARLNSKAVGTEVENVNYAIKSTYLLNIYRMLPEVETLPSSSQVASKDLAQQVEVLKNFVCLIRVY